MNRTAYVCLLAGVMAAGCGHEAAEEVESETIVPVVTAPASTGTIRGSISVTGVVTPAPGAEQVVVAPQPARIADIPKAEGDRVATGDILVRFELPALAADVATRRSEITRAQARIQNARAAQTRAHDLFDRGVAARREVEEADREVADAQADLAAAQATLGAAETTAGLAVVRARFNGIVAKRSHNPGDMADAAASDPVLRIVDPTRLEITASVPIPDVGSIAVGSRGHARNPGGGDDIDVRVISRPAAVDPGTAAVPIRLAAQADGLTVGAPMQVRLDTAEHTHVVLVPQSAIVREGDETAVFVANGDKATRTVVTLGLEDGEHVEIVSGLNAGASVIVKGQAGLPDGAKITTGTPKP